MKQITSWELSFGTYQGILFGIRTYESENGVTYVGYLPFIDVARTFTTIEQEQ